MRRTLLLAAAALAGAPSAPASVRALAKTCGPGYVDARLSRRDKCL
jgi:hypothetical protein